MSHGFQSILLLRHAVMLLAAAVVVPIIFGLTARVFLFRRDEDDADLYTAENGSKRAARPLDLEHAAPEANEPEPQADYEMPWPRFSPSADRK